MQIDLNLYASNRETAPSMAMQWAGVASAINQHTDTDAMGDCFDTSPASAAAAGNASIFD